MRRLPLIASFVLFIALCASIAYWGMQLFKPPLRPVAAPPRAAKADIRPEAAVALFGSRPNASATAVASNYQLNGVIFSGSPRSSVAILSADGQPAQAVKVDAEVVPGVTVKEVHRNYVLLSENGTIKRVELPENTPDQIEAGSAPPSGASAPNQSARPAARNGSIFRTPNQSLSRSQAAAPPGAQIPPRGPAMPMTQSTPAATMSPRNAPSPSPAAAAQQVQTPPPPAVQQAPGTSAPPTVVVSPPPSSTQSAPEPAPVQQQAPQQVQQGNVPPGTLQEPGIPGLPPPVSSPAGR